MIAFHNDPKVKEFYINRVKEHMRLDEIKKGFYWENGKGCAVGCTIHGNEHSKYETELGILQILATLEDKIFESLPNKLSKTWPLRFLESIKIGADLSKVWPKFAIFLLTDSTQCNSRHPQCKIIADAYKNELEGKKQNWDLLRKNAYVAYIIATYNTAHTAAAYTAATIAGASPAISMDATYTAYAADFVADKKNAYIKQSEKLLELLKECKGK